MGGKDARDRGSTRNVETVFRGHDTVCCTRGLTATEDTLQHGITGGKGLMREVPPLCEELSLLSVARGEDFSHGVATGKLSML